MAEAVLRDVDHQHGECREADQQAEEKHGLEHRSGHARPGRGRSDVTPAAMPRVVTDAAGAHSYTSRYLRTSRMLIRFITNVARNSVAPTAKIVLYSRLPVGTSPIPTDPM